MNGPTPTPESKPARAAVAIPEDAILPDPTLGEEPCPLCGKPAGNALWAPKAACWIKTHLACVTGEDARAKLAQFVGADYLDGDIVLRPASSLLDAPIPYRVSELGEEALGAPRVHGVIVTRELIAAIGRVEAAGAIARANQPGLSLGDFLQTVHDVAERS